MTANGKTGEKVTVAGVYKNKYGKKVTLQEGHVFPACPEKGRPIEWQKEN